MSLVNNTRASFARISIGRSTISIAAAAGRATAKARAMAVRESARIAALPPDIVEQAVRPRAAARRQPRPRHRLHEGRRPRHPIRPAAHLWLHRILVAADRDGGFDFPSAVIQLREDAAADPELQVAEALARGLALGFVVGER